MSLQQTCLLVSQSVLCQDDWIPKNDYNFCFGYVCDLSEDAYYFVDVSMLTFPCDNLFFTAVSKADLATINIQQAIQNDRTTLEAEMAKTTKSKTNLEVFKEGLDLLEKIYLNGVPEDKVENVPAFIPAFLVNTFTCIKLDDPNMILKTRTVPGLSF